MPSRRPGLALFVSARQYDVLSRAFPLWMRTVWPSLRVSDLRPLGYRVYAPPPELRRLLALSR